MSYIPRKDRPADKSDFYAEVEAKILAVLEGEDSDAYLAMTHRIPARN